jgi:hypothetical protein
MKYVLPALALIALSSCTSSPKTYVCMSALTPLGGIEVDTSNPDVTEHAVSLEFKARDNLTIVIPKSLCVEVRGPRQ